MLSVSDNNFFKGASFDTSHETIHLQEKFESENQYYIKALNYGFEVHLPKIRRGNNENK